LREVAEPVEDPGSPEVTALVADLRDTLAHWRRTTGYGRAIAAPQIGIRKRLVFLNLGEPWPMINPAIVERSEETMVVWDACLSFLFVFCPGGAPPRSHRALPGPRRVVARARSRGGERSF
jgi:peptide deformylase